MKSIRILIALLSIVLTLSLCALAEEASPWYYDNSNYLLRLNGELSGDVVVPAEVDGYITNAIAFNAFYNQNSVTSVTLPDTLRALQGGAFSDMASLTSVTLNEGLEYIDSNFNRCNALTSLTIPASVRAVKGFISSCENLKEIWFEGPCPLFLNTDLCFFMMPEDYIVYVPDDQLEAYAQALADANGAADHLRPSGKNAVIPEAPNSEEWFDFDASTGVITGYKAYNAYVEIPETIGGAAVKAIGAGAFASDYSVYAIEFPEGLERIEAGAFKAASNLAYAKLPSTLRAIGDDAFFNAQITRIDWSEGLEEIGARAFQYDLASVLRLPESVKRIGESAFEGSRCEELYLGGNVEFIGSRAFANTNLNYLVFDLYQPIDIAADAFVGAYVADLDLPWNSSFANRDAYAELLKDQCPDCTVWINNPISGGVAEYPTNDGEITRIENGVWTLYNGAQADLTVWTAYDDVNVCALGDGVFKGNQNIRSFYPHHCGWFTTIGNEAFADSSVEVVELFGSITTIGDEAFRNCTNITQLPLPASLTSIGAGAFEGCTGITELILPASLTRIGAGALDGCANLTKLTVLCDPAILPENLLANCPALTEVYAAPDATAEQVRSLSALVGRPWYAPVPRVGEALHFTEMPYAPLPGEDFWYDEEYSRLDTYNGYELNLVLPREIDGVQLTTFGGGMMNRASAGDNYALELPVRSLVIPETYAEIPAFAFWNCETLETVICYAPLETLAEGTFNGCANLREVVFVNGVRNIERYAFAGCSSLDTVYIGPYTETIDENAFGNNMGETFFSIDRCITDLAQLSDVDALLAAVRSDPLPAPEDDPEPEAPLAPEPIGDEGAAFFGTWIGTSLEMDGATFSFADFGLEMNLTFNPDGTAALYDGEENNVAAWSVADGAAILDGMRFTLQEDGALCMEEDGAKMFFARGDAESAPAPEASAEPEVPAATGALDRMDTRFVMASADVQGYSMTPEQLGGLEYALVFHADGTMEFTMAGTKVPGLQWTQGTVQTDAGEADAYIIDYYGTPLPAALTETGFDMNYFDSMLIHFAPEA